MIDKEQLRSELLTLLTQQRQNALEAASSAHDDATHEQSVAETQYDTVGLESAYLAHGQSQRVMDCDQMISQIQSLHLKEFDELDDINLGALITLSTGMVCWFLPVCGGVKLSSGKVIVITPHSPLGEMLDGAEQGEVLEDGREVIDVR
ncbi:hypothetical protein N9R79_06155 [Vibrio sp.]|nr:hypothetical protein [Vibrio sp.]